MMTIGNFQTTAIGSLPHHNIDTALTCSFRTDIPFLPQIPIRNAWEFMLAQALEGLPGLQAEHDGSVTLNPGIWRSRSATLDRALDEAFAKPASDIAAFEPFEPSPAVSSGWQPFVWELSERKCAIAKIQIAGPLTAQWSIRMRSNEVAPEIHHQATMQIYRLVLARALGMSRKLRAMGVTPLVYIDEPALYGLDLTNPKHALGLREAQLVIQSLRKDGALVGIHCCSNTDWGAVLGLGIDVLSIDSALSLPSLVASEYPKYENALREFLAHGRLSLGVVPTARPGVLHSLNAQALFAALIEAFRPWKTNPDLIHETLSRAIYTPACGLALHSVADAEFVLDLLEEFRSLVRVSLAKGQFHEHHA